MAKKWYQTGKFKATMVGLAVPGLFGLGAAAVPLFGDDEPVCSEEYVRYAEVIENHPDAVIVVDDDELQKICHISEFIASIRDDHTPD